MSKKDITIIINALRQQKERFDAQGMYGAESEVDMTLIKMMFLEKKMERAEA